MTFAPRQSEHSTSSVDWLFMEETSISPPLSPRPRVPYWVPRAGTFLRREMIKMLGFGATVQGNFKMYISCGFINLVTRRNGKDEASV